MHIKTPSFEVEEGWGGGGRGCRQRPPYLLWFGGSCSSIVVLTTSPRNSDLVVKKICSSFSKMLARYFLTPGKEFLLLPKGQKCR